MTVVVVAPPAEKVFFCFQINVIFVARFLFVFFFSSFYSIQEAEERKKEEKTYVTFL